MSVVYQGEGQICMLGCARLTRARSGNTGVGCALKAEGGEGT
jgi:hypothetical protein